MLMLYFHTTSVPPKSSQMCGDISLSQCIQSCSMHTWLQRRRYYWLSQSVIVSDRWKPMVLILEMSFATRAPAILQPETESNLVCPHITLPPAPYVVVVLPVDGICISDKARIIRLRGRRGSLEVPSAILEWHWERGRNYDSSGDRCSVSANNPHMSQLLMLEQMKGKNSWHLLCINILCLRYLLVSISNPCTWVCRDLQIKNKTVGRPRQDRPMVRFLTVIYIRKI